MRPRLIGRPSCRLLAAMAVAAVGPVGVQAQLISPGKLAAPHAELEGLRGCTSCHQLGQRGVSSERCLSCHEGVATRIAEGRGFHATVPGDACGRCHQDHLGPDFDLLRLDPDDFDHEVVGFPLEARHAEVGCRNCHAPENIADESLAAFKRERDALDRTFLGLGTVCGTCHASDDPHGGQFDGRGCDGCHDVGGWNEAAGFDHSVAAFTLEGRHAGLSCAQCHRTSASTTVYRPVAHGACSDCHDDPHGGAMRSDCASCHDAAGWLRLSTAGMDGGFDHGRTTFALEGAHADATCTECHRTGAPPRTQTISIAYRPGTADLTYPRPVATSCASCHVVAHASESDPQRWASCDACHSQGAWAPSSFGVARHGTHTAFALTGAHLATPCTACHEAEPGAEADPGAESGFQLGLGSPDCEACHGTDDPHGGSYAPLTCGSCHTTEAFDEAAFDHAETVDPELLCASCHAEVDPHEGQFGDRDCRGCHGTETFTIDRFDHGTTRFPLEGAHVQATCRACHGPPDGSDGAALYRPLGMECRDCHGGAG